MLSATEIFIGATPHRALYPWDHPSRDDQAATRWPLIHMPRKVGRLKPSMKSSISASVCSSRMAWREAEPCRHFVYGPYLA
jgi:hypothetical protein